MAHNQPANGQADQIKLSPGTPAKKMTDNPNDPFWMAGDKIERDNAIELGKDSGDKKDKTER